MLLVAAVPGAVKAGAGSEDVEVGEVGWETAWVQTVVLPIVGQLPSRLEGAGLSQRMSRLAEMVCHHVAWEGLNVLANSRTSG